MSEDISAPQIRAARALVGWSARELASTSGVSLPTIQRFERGTVGTKPETIEQLVATLNRAGAEFICNGVKLSKEKSGNGQ